MNPSRAASNRGLDGASGRISRRTRRLAALVAAGVALPLAVTGCTSAAAADDGRLQVLASFYPLQMVAETVGGDRVHVETLTPPGAEPHDVELSPRQVSHLETADLVVYESGFQAAVDDAVALVKPAHVVDAAHEVQLQTVSEERAQGARTGDEAPEDSESNDAHHGIDPHFWLDPALLHPVVDAVAAELTQIDPAGADVYRANADALSARLTALSADFEAGLAQCRTRIFVTSHEAFGYLAERYHLTEVGISGIDPESEPSPKRIADVSKLVEAEGITTLFYEPLASPKVVQTLADELGVEARVLDPIEGITTEGDDYFSIQARNLTELRDAMGCT